MNRQCIMCGYDEGSAHLSCIRCKAIRDENNLIAACNRIAAQPLGCIGNDHHFVIANDDSLKCEGCGVKIAGENLAALGFVHRSNVCSKPSDPIDPFIAKLEPIEHEWWVENKRIRQVFINPAFAAACGLAEGRQIARPEGIVEVRLDVNVGREQIIPCEYRRDHEHDFLRIDEDGLRFLREPVDDVYRVGPGRYYASLQCQAPAQAVHFTIPDEPTPAKVHETWVIKSVDPSAGLLTCEVKKPTEAPCRTCGKSNDTGVKVCWMCGGEP